MARLSSKPRYSRYHEFLTFEICNKEPLYCNLKVSVDPSIVRSCYHEAIQGQKKLIPGQGFGNKNIPDQFIEKTYKTNLDEHIKEIVLKTFVLGFVYDEVMIKKVPLAGEPRLNKINIKSPDRLEYLFDCSLLGPIPFQEWKLLPFKAPKRKNYKDLDRQVETFLHEEQINRRNYKDNGIEIGDWVNFALTITTQEGKRILPSKMESVLWLRVGEEEADRPLQELFVGKKIDDNFCLSGKYLDYYFNEPISTAHTFCITILDIEPGAFFSVDQFKQHFKLKTNKETNQKMIEVFSFKNDISQRRIMAQEALKLLFTKNKFEVPNYLILRQQRTVLEAVQENPDYHVYRSQKDFKERVRQLAEIQTKDQILIDQLAFHENIIVTHQDLKNYLNLTKRPRIKEFLYFDMPITKRNSQEYPVIDEELKRACLREKTLNHVIHYLTKQY